MSVGVWFRKPRISSSISSKYYGPLLLVLCLSLLAQLLGKSHILSLLLCVPLPLLLELLLPHFLGRSLGSFLDWLG